MIVKETNGKFTMTYSDQKRYIRKVDTDEVYAEAVDLEGKNYEYEETEEVIEDEVLE